MSRIKEYIPSAQDCGIAGDYAADIYTSLMKGNAERALRKINELFDFLREDESSFEGKRSFCVEVYIEIITKSIRRSSTDRLRKIADIAVSNELDRIEKIIVSEAKAVAAENAPEYGGSSNALIKETLHIINENIGNERLSLRWIAGNILYTNVDYLGKIFKKEIGKNFSYYVMEKRMEIAKKLLEEGEVDKIYEAAEQVGYGTNSQYFSQVFKKYTGVSPLEYKESSKKNKKSGS